MLFHSTHTLRVSVPYVYCVRCGRLCASKQHLQALRRICEARNGPLPKGSPYISRLRSLLDGVHPITGVAFTVPSVPSPAQLLASGP